MTKTDLPLYWRERFEERAAVKEFHGGVDRKTAEQQALKEILELMNPKQKPLFK